MNNGADNILVVHPDRKTQRTLHRILGATLCDVDAVDNLQQADQLLQQRTPRLVVLEHGLALSESGQAFASHATSRGTTACLVLIGERPQGDAPKSFRCRSLTNLLGNPMPLLAEELTVTALKLLRDDIFGLNKYLSWGVETRRIELTDAAQRSEVVDKVTHDVREFGLGPRVASLVSLIADELLSNALYNAPTDDAGMHIHKDSTRHAPRPLSGRDVVALEYGCDARYFAVGVTDQYGSLKRETVLDHLAKCAARGGPDKVNFDTTGAGMGLGIIYGACNHLVFNLEPAKRAEVIGLLDVRFKPAELSEGQPSFNVFVQDQGDA